MKIKIRSRPIPYARQINTYPICEADQDLSHMRGRSIPIPYARQIKTYPICEADQDLSHMRGRSIPIPYARQLVISHSGHMFSPLGEVRFGPVPHRFALVVPTRPRFLELQASLPQVGHPLVLLVLVQHEPLLLCERNVVVLMHH